MLDKWISRENCVNIYTWAEFRIFTRFSNFLCKRNCYENEKHELKMIQISLHRMHLF